jgi:hypothetical protein
MVWGVTSSFDCSTKSKQVPHLETGVCPPLQHRSRRGDLEESTFYVGVMGNIFISHSSQNVDRAKEVFGWLTANGWDDVFAAFYLHNTLILFMYW